MKTGTERAERRAV